MVLWRAGCYLSFCRRGVVTRVACCCRPSSLSLGGGLSPRCRSFFNGGDKENEGTGRGISIYAFAFLLFLLLYIKTHRPLTGQEQANRTDNHCRFAVPYFPSYFASPSPLSSAPPNPSPTPPSSTHTPTPSNCFLPSITHPRPYPPPTLGCCCRWKRARS